MYNIFIKNNKVISIAYSPQGHEILCSVPYDSKVHKDNLNGIEVGYNYDSITDTFTYAAPVVKPPTVSPVQFKLLFTITERMAITALKQTDPIMQDMFTILDDPRLNDVDLSLQSTKDILLYLVSKGMITANRVDEILTGVIT